MRAQAYFLFFMYMMGMSCRTTFFEMRSKQRHAIHVEIRIRHGLPEIPVKIEGKTLWLMLDLGSWKSISLHPKLIHAIKGKYSGKSIHFRDAKGNKMKAKQFLLPKIRIGGLQLRQVKGYEHRFSSSFAPPNKVGHIGLGILREFDIIIDIPKKRLTFLPMANKQAPVQGQQVSISSLRYGVVTKLAHRNKRYKAIWDTGATHSFVKAKKGEKVPENLVWSNFCVGKEWVRKLPVVRFNFQQPPVDVYLGFHFFKMYRVHISFRQKLIWLYKYDKEGKRKKEPGGKNERSIRSCR